VELILTITLALSEPNDNMAKLPTAISKINFPAFYCSPVQASIPQWTVPQLSIMVIYNSTWSVLIQWIMFILSGDNLT